MKSELEIMTNFANELAIVWIHLRINIVGNLVVFGLNLSAKISCETLVMSEQMLSSVET